MKTPKDSKGRLLTRRRAVYNTFRPPVCNSAITVQVVTGDITVSHAGGDGAGGSDRRVVTGSDGGLPNSSDGR